MAAAKGKSFGKVLADSMALKLTVLLTLVSVVAFVAWSALSAQKSGEASTAPAAAQMGTANLGQPATPAYATAMNQANKDRADDARKHGDSALPTPVTTAGATTDPLAAYKVPDHVVPRETTVAPAGIAAPSSGPDKYQQMLDRLGQAMRQDLDRFEKDTKLPAGKVVLVSEQRNGAAVGNATVQNAVAASTTKPSEKKNYLLMAGDQAYAQVLPKLNSDVESPIVANIYSGPLNGGRAIGRFKSSEECVVLSFSTATLDGQEYPIEAVAVDPETGGFCIADDVNHHYLERIVMPALAAFAGGYGDAAKQSRSSVVITGTTATTATDPLSPTDKLFSAGGKAAEKLGGILEEKSRSAKPTVTVYAGRPVGMWFLKSVEAK